MKKEYLNHMIESIEANIKITFLIDLYHIYYLKHIKGACVPG